MLGGIKGGRKSNLKSIKLIVFDFDGVLAKSNGDPFNSFLEHHVSDPILREALRKAKNHKFKSSDWIAELKKAGVDTSNRDLLDGISEFVFNMTKSELKICRGITRVVPELAKRVPLAIVSNNCFLAIEHCLGALIDYFKIIKTWVDVDRLKPHPEGLMSISKEAGFSPQEIFFVGDTIEDKIASMEAGTQIAIARWGNKYPYWDDLPEKEVGDLLFLENPETLLEIIPKKRRALKKHKG